MCGHTGQSTWLCYCFQPCGECLDSQWSICFLRTWEQPNALLGLLSSKFVQGSANRCFQNYISTFVAFPFDYLNFVLIACVGGGFNDVYTTQSRTRSYPLFDIPVRYLQVQVEYLNRQRIFGATIYSHGNAKLVLNSMILFLSQQDLISSQNSVTYIVI